MTIPATTPKVLYSGDDVTDEFPITFIYWDASDIRAVVNIGGVETVWVLNTDYTLSGGNGATGTLTATTPPATGTTLMIRSSRAAAQEVALPLGGPLPSTDIEQALDKVVRITQQLQEEVDRSVKTEETSALNNVTVPAPVAGKALLWNATEDALENSVDDLNGIVADATTQAGIATTQAGIATTAANNAANSASTAATSATNASNSASAASTSASNASTSETNAASSASAASTSASNASTSATNASNSASAASTSATNAASSASTASTSASNASTSASNAATSATNAAASAAAALASETNAAASEAAAALSAASLPNAPTAGADAFLRTNATANGWSYLSASEVATAIGAIGSGDIANMLETSDIGVSVQAYDADTAKTDVAQNFTLPQRSALLTDNDLSFDVGAKQNFLCTPTAGGTLTFTNHATQGGQSGYIRLVNGSNYAIAAHADTKITDADLAKISASGTYVMPYLCNGTDVEILGVWTRP